MSRYKLYPSYKESGVEWLGEVPEHWQRIKFKHTFFEKKKETNTALNCGSISFGEVIFKDDEKIPEETKASYQEVLAGEFLVNPLNLNYDLKSLRTALSKIDVVVSSGYIVLKSHENAHKNYLRWLLYQFDIAHMKTLGSGVRQTINYADIGNSYFLEPTPTEQTAIANFLDMQTAKIDTLIEKQQQLIDLLKEKRQAIISHAVTKGLKNQDTITKIYRLDWVCRIIRGNTGFKKDELLESGEYVALQYGKTYKVDEVNDLFEFYINNEFYKSEQVVHSGDTILISTSETMEDLGHSCFYNRTQLGLIGGEQILLKPNKQFLFPKYLYYYSKLFCTRLRKYATGLKVFRFNTDDLKNIFLAIPSIEEQQEIANSLDTKTNNIDTLIEKSNMAIDLLKERRTALISAAVTGKIDVRETH